jgi:Domain of unknown function (DUF4412)
LRVETPEMKPLRLALLIVAGLCLLQPRILPAQTAAAPYTPDKQYSADQVITTKDGMNVTSKVYADDGKMRTEMTTQGMQMISIIRPDQKKMYSVMPAQKMVMTMSLDSSKLKNMPSTTGDDSKFETVGPDLVDGTPCIKYKMTSSKTDKVFLWWVAVGTKAPVKMAADDGSFTLVWKNYKTGPQDAALFEPPADYQVMEMPSAPPAGQ